MTLTEGILLGAIIGWTCSEASGRFLEWVDRAPVTDDLDVTEYRAHAGDVYDQEQEPDNRAVAALRAELADDVALGRWLG